MSNLLDLDSFGKNLEDVRSHITYIIPVLEETVQELVKQDYNAFISKEHTKLKESTIAREIVKLKTKKETYEYIINLFKGVIS